MKDVHKAQTLSYARMTGLPIGLLINFNEAVVKDGIRRLVNERSPLLSSSPRSPRLPVQSHMAKG